MSYSLNSTPLSSKKIDDNMYVFIDTYNTKISSDVLIPLLHLILKYKSKIYFYLTGVVFNRDHIEPFKHEWRKSIIDVFGPNDTIININCCYYDLYSNKLIETNIGSYIMQTVGLDSHKIGSLVLISGNADTKTRNIPLWQICETSLIWGWSLCVISWLSNTNNIYNILNNKYGHMSLFNIELLLQEKEKYDTRLLHAEWKKYQMNKSTEYLEPMKDLTSSHIFEDDYYTKSPIEQAKETALSCINRLI